jgi:LPPG:FO 2-phospho-L-lactate transferase
VAPSSPQPGAGPVVILAGGTGGAKLARGMLDVVAPGELTIIANSGDDVEIYGAYVAPDADLVTFWLADRIDERGWGLDGDTFAVMEGLRELGVEVWFQLGDRDLAIGLQRAQALARGGRLTEAHAAIVRALGVAAQVLPASDRPVRTRVMTGGRWLGFQEYMIQARAQGPVEDVAFHGIRAATPTPEALAAVAAARAIVIGPSNPVASIGPILELPGMREALRAAPAPVIAVSPLVAGQVLKGPTAAFMAHAGHSLDADGIAGYYAGVIEGLVSDEATERVAVHETAVLMDTQPARRRLAAEALEFALSLR